MPTSPSNRRLAGPLMILCALIVIACLAVPMYVIRPFVPQDAYQLAFALAVRRAGPWLSAIAVAVALSVLLRFWRGFSRGAKIGCALLLLVTAAGAVFTHVNLFEIMFKPYGAATFEPIHAAKIDADDKVLSVTIRGQSHAFPIRTMGYHHIVNDVVAGDPIAATYCTLCHTGLIWSRVLNGQTLTFRLAGINNGNALLRDEQTSSIWQQSTGEAIFGPLKGSHLALVHSDELTFALWRQERPNGLVLKPEAQYEPEYDPKDWDTRVLRYRTIIDTAKSGIGPHELMLGVSTDGSAKAYPIKAILGAGVIEDRIGEEPVVLVVGADRASIRVFKARAFGSTAALTLVPSSDPSGEVMKDAETGSAFDFRGCAVSGRYAGQCLDPVDSHKDFWFDWLNHNPATAVFRN